MNNERTLRFNIITPKDLNPVAIVPQGIDNVWIPKRLLPDVASKGLSIENVIDEILPEAKKEWRRSLIYGDQIVLNRAFLYNSRVVFSDFLDPYHHNTLAFKKLLEAAVVVPFLYIEEPDELPASFDEDDKGWKAWQQLAEFATFVRFSPSKSTNADLAKNMAIVFRNYFNLALDPDYGPQIFSGFASSLGEAIACYEYFSEQMKGIDRAFTRATLYEHFLWMPKDRDVRVSPLKRMFDPTKKHIPILKQLFDLKYNVNTPDFLDRYALTPYGMPSRGLLKDNLAISARQTDENLDLDKFHKSLERLAFDSIQQGLYLHSISALELPDIVAIRGLGEPFGVYDASFLPKARSSWQALINSQRTLITDPLNFPLHGLMFFRAFAEFNQALTGYIKPRLKSSMYSGLHPILKFIFEIPGILAIIIPLGEFHGKIPFKIVEHAVASGAGKFSEKLIGRIVVTYFSESVAKSDLEFSISFMERRVTDAINEWPRFANSLKNDSKFMEVKEVGGDSAPVINYEEEQQGEPR